jgi:hypothetical protein
MPEYSAVTRRRLNDGQQALETSKNPLPESIQGLTELRNQLHDGIAALQSLDDLGSEQANQQAWDDMIALQVRYDEVTTKLKELENQDQWGMSGIR